MRDVHINALYFISLTLALSVSSICILAKQWIREYQKGVVSSSRDGVRVRQMRFDSLETWNVPQMIAALPVILLTALILFFSGLLVQLWHVPEHTTAVAVTVVATLTAFFIAITTIAPAYCSMQPCRDAFVPFRSPQSWMFFAAYRRFQWFFGILFSLYEEDAPMLPSWIAFDLHVLTIEHEDWFEHNVSSVHRSLQWACKAFRNSDKLQQAIQSICTSPVHHPQGLIKSLVGLANYTVENPPWKVALVVYMKYWREVGQAHNISSPSGRHQVELLIRIANESIDRFPWDPPYHIDMEFLRSFRLMSDHGIYDSVDNLPQEIVHCELYLVKQMPPLL